MNISNQILSDLTTYMKYAKYQPELGRRETWDELVTRNMNMHIKRYPSLTDEIRKAYKFVYDKKVLPSMRSLQFAGKSIEISPNRIYNCLAREQEFITSTGVMSFDDFNDGDEISVLSHLGNWKRATVKSYGKQLLNRITFVRGKSKYEVYATDSHRWVLYDGAETTELKPKDIIYPSQKTQNFDYDSADPFEKLYWAYGYVYGDGTVTSNGTSKYSMVRLCGEESNRYRYRFEELGFKTSTSLSLDGDFMAYTGKYLKTLPEVDKTDLNLLKAFVSGLLDADAYKNPDWYGNNTLGKYRSILQHSAETVDFLKTSLPLIGYYITNIKDIAGHETAYGIRPDGAASIHITNHIGSRRNTAWSVKKIEQTERYETVWCLEVEDDHSFMFPSGLVTGNCAYLPIDDFRAFSETMFLLLGGTGVGYSVQFHHVDQLPEIRKPNPNRTRRFLIGDSIEGWADTVKVLMRAYFEGKSTPIFDYSDIRPKGAQLITSGGKAPGPQPLKDCVHNITKILNAKENASKLTSLEVHDIICFIADAVLAGGIRRAALISLFSFDDGSMSTCKFGNWWELNPQRGRSNNSAVIMRHRVKKREFLTFFERVKNSRSGEPGVYFSNDKDMGTNPCAEISLRPNQFCNLTEINSSDVKDQADLNDRAITAAFLGTLQAGYTDFHYLRDVWKRTTEKEALVGVGMTGIASGTVFPLDLEEAAREALKENTRVAKLIGINSAARTTTVKPSGTSSLVLGCSSGIHAWHAKYYIRHIRVGKNEAIYQYLALNHPELVEDEYFRPQEQAVIKIPQMAPDTAITREDETTLSFLERVARWNDEWVATGHRKGPNTHNVSATVSVKLDEWDMVAEWIWKHRSKVNGLSCLPHNDSDHSYMQAPFQECTKAEYVKMMKSLTEVELINIREVEDNTTLSQELACAGEDGCEII